MLGHSLATSQAGPQVVLDIGCGSGISGSVLSHHGHAWVGCDISPDMLALAQGNLPPAQPVQHLAQPQRQCSTASSTASATTMPSVQANAPLASRTGHNTLNHRRAMYSIADMAEARGRVLQADMAQGLPFRPNSIDGAISISAVQWLCHMPNPEAALQKMFRSLYKCLKPRCKAVLQVYLTGKAVPPSLCTVTQFETKLSFKASA